jgi:hypothetical protein
MNQLNRLAWSNISNADKTKNGIQDLLHKHVHRALWQAEFWASMGLDPESGRQPKHCLKLTLKNQRTALVRYAALQELNEPGHYYPKIEARFCALENAITDLKSKIADEAAK